MSATERVTLRSHVSADSRGWIVAFLLSLLLHGLAWMAWKQSWDFKFNVTKGEELVSTRLILAQSQQEAQLAEPQPEPTKSTLPSTSVQTERREERSPSATPQLPSSFPAPEAEAKQEPPEVQNFEQNDVSPP